MTRLSASELAIVRTQPQSTKLNLSVFQPRTVLACQITGSVVRGDRTIPFDTVSAGSYLAVESGMTLLVGTTAGARDLGKIRVKSISSGSVVVSENSHIPWVNDAHITVQRYWEVWPIYPRIITDPANSEDVIFYKDYDDAYTNQNTILGATVCAGNHRAIWAGESTYFSASGTAHLASSALTYNWAFEGGSSITGSTSHTPGNVQYNTAGYYVTRLIVTGANGSVDTTYRYVSVYNKPENSANNNPIKNWELSNLAGSRGEGGNHGSIRITEENISIHDGLPVVLFADDWYGTANSSYGGNAVGNSKIFFSGHILTNTIRLNAITSSIEFDIGNISEIMKITETFSISLETSASPTKWFQMLDMDSRRAIYHYLKYHSTVLFLADFEFAGTDQKIQYFDTDRESVFDAVDNYMRGTLLGEFISDRQGKLWAEVGTPFYTSPTGSFTTIMAISRGDWMGEPSIQNPLSNSTSFIEAGGVAYSGTSTGTYQAFLSQAPGATPNGRGTPENITGLAITGQPQLNTISGNLYAQKNSRYPTIDMDLKNGFRNLDIAPQESVGINILTTDTPLGVAINQPYTPESISWRYDTNSQLLLPNVGWKSLDGGLIGTTITIPEIPENQGFSSSLFGGGANFNPISFPAVLSGFGTNVPTAKYAGSFTFSSGINTNVVFTTKAWEYGFLPGGVLDGYQPTVMIGGIYEVVLTGVFSSISPGYSFGFGTSIFTAIEQALYNTMVDPTFCFVAHFIAAAGQTIRVFVIDPSTGAGTFTCKIRQIYAI
jgi:hypothetical protein